MAVVAFFLDGDSTIYQLEQLPSRSSMLYLYHHTSMGNRRLITASKKKTNGTTVAQFAFLRLTVTRS